MAHWDTDPMNSGSQRPGPWAQLWMLREDALANPDFTFRGPAVTLITDLLRVARGNADAALAADIDELISFAGLTQHYPTDALADLLQRVLIGEEPNLA